ncbi:tRNA pseudouridine synthase A [Geodia barretti]|uniref:tRNA pseudouridine synthase n=1 Tax=Geodia barretti TaxID=519541 RepID=A0AA35X4Q6_GEOBA|nr:tRNA pseudouridine synthase A [Geodia barretti]
MNVRLTLEYDGTDYRGWQIQPGGPTIQGILEDALAVLLKQRVRVQGSGRTDTGVHARGQVANFACPDGRDLTRIQRGLNALTPDDMTIRAVEAASPSFDARRDARRRVSTNTACGTTLGATGYLRHMVRNIVGTLVQIGLGERDAGGLPALIDSRDRTQAGPTAPRTGPVPGGGVLRIGIRGESVRRMASFDSASRSLS